MRTYTESNLSTIERPTPARTRTSDAYAEAAKNKAFRPCDLRLARELGAPDRRPDQQPRRLGEVIDQVIPEAGREALSHWLDFAAQAETDAERGEALAMAEGIAKRMGIPLANFLFGRVA